MNYKSVVEIDIISMKFKVLTDHENMNYDPFTYKWVGLGYFIFSKGCLGLAKRFN